MSSVPSGQSTCTTTVDVAVHRVERRGSWPFFCGRRNPSSRPRPRSPTPAGWCRPGRPRREAGNPPEHAAVVRVLETPSSAGGPRHAAPTAGLGRLQARAVGQSPELLELDVEPQPAHRPSRVTVAARGAAAPPRRPADRPTRRRRRAAARWRRTSRRSRGATRGRRTARGPRPGRPGPTRRTPAPRGKTRGGRRHLHR